MEILIFLALIPLALAGLIILIGILSSILVFITGTVKDEFQSNQRGLGNVEQNPALESDASRPLALPRDAFVLLKERRRLGVFMEPSWCQYSNDNEIEDFVVSVCRDVLGDEVLSELDFKAFSTVVRKTILDFASAMEEVGGGLEEQFGFASAAFSMILPELRKNLESSTSK